MKRRDFLQSSAAVALTSVAGVRIVYAAAKRGTTPDVVAVTGDGREITLRGVGIEKLASELDGDVLLAGEPGYDQARQLLNPSFDKHPALVVQPTTSR